MKERIDRQYLKPQIKILEDALIEWSVIFIVFFSRFVYVESLKDPGIISFLSTFIVFYVIFGMFYVGLRTSIPSYFAVRKVVMADDDK